MWGGMVSCGHCEEKFTHESLRRHIKSMNGGYKKQCPECHNFFAHVNNHIQQVHKRAKKRPLIKCSTCKKMFTGRSYATHECITGSKVKNSTKCGICPKICSTKKLCNSHLQIEHLPVISRDIGITGDIKTENSVLREEIAGIFAISQFVQSDRKNYMLCKLCLRTIQDYSNKMTFHMKTHLGFNSKGQVQSDKEAAELIFEK